ncbi:hypothetical protein EVJ50_14110 [Synechococcus sp. RSCCF101]|uniref:hypothetical protein n=1 Tax=Synechococcus sp. RSCCF101 TaxID=2511069 RepID=UPI001245289A|nr:hypothetical protein [Synechococcus sp. RSCCF101]QEY33199.1 hypothetical protein EVJ50_14110 [Synechococcus sp. RSCCF101]
MAATRLSDSQKQELLRRFRDGATAQSLALEFGCSPTTVGRAIRAQVSPEEYAALKQGRPQQKGGQAQQMAQPEASVAPRGEAASRHAPNGDAPSGAASSSSRDPEEADDDGELAVPGSLAIEDADDFSGDDSDDGDLSDDDLRAAEEDPSTFVLLAPADAVQPRPPARVESLADAALPSRLYMLVDKAVELEPRPLSTFTELGALPDGEAERAALALYGSPRTAKRECGRSQKVIPLPDPQVVLRTSTYLLAQGISRVVLDGRPYALDR